MVGWELHIVKDVGMWSIISSVPSSICSVMRTVLNDGRSCDHSITWWCSVEGMFILFSIPEVTSNDTLKQRQAQKIPKRRYPIGMGWNTQIIPGSLLLCLDYTRISPTMPGLYPDISYYARIIPGSLLPSPQGLPKRQRRWSRGGCCATMRLCSYTLAWRNDLSILLKGNSPLNKVELDIPCLRLSEDGKLLGVLKEVVLNIRKLLLWILQFVKTLVMILLLPARFRLSAASCNIMKLKLMWYFKTLGHHLLVLSPEKLIYTLILHWIRF